MKRYIGVNKKHAPMDASRRLSMTDHEIQLFESIHVRSHWDEAQEKWYFSVVDVVRVLTDSTNPTDYLKKLRKRDAELGATWGQIVPRSPCPVPLG
jgi:hypothetical protein